jgi:hypothetical protein
MNKLTHIIALTTFVACKPTLAFEISTHAVITNQSYSRSKLVTDTTSLKRLGIDSYVNLSQSSKSVFGSQYYDFSGVAVAIRTENSYEREAMKRVGLVDDRLKLNGWVMRGAIREDDNPTDELNSDKDVNGIFHREFNHFFDPQKNRPLTRTGIGVLYSLDTGTQTLRKAPDWAMGTDDIFANPNQYGADTLNKFTIHNAREAMYRALTLRFRVSEGQYQDLYPPTVSAAEKEANRKAWWATAFRAVGDMLHLNQDMAQPQHTRNEAHSGLGGAFSNSVSGHGSVFEKYIDARARRDEFVIDGQAKQQYPQLDFGSQSSHPLPTFATYRDYWSTAPGVDGQASGKGLADYSSRGFLTAANNIGDSEYSAPANAVSSYTKVPTNYPSASSSIKINLLDATVPDALMGTSAPIHMATESMWANLIGPGTIYNMTRVNFDDHAKLLIPRAVSYSAGLIDYFFRGQMQIFLPAEGVYGVLDHSIAADNCKNDCGFKKIKLKLANSTADINVSGGGASVAQAMTGGTLVAVAKFHKNNCYTSDLEGEYDSSKDGRTALQYVADCNSTEESITVSQPLVNQTVPNCAGGTTAACEQAAMALTFTFDTPIPINATDLYLQVVYRGKLGSEDDAVVVETKNVTEPTFFMLVNVTDYLGCYNGNYFYKNADGSLPASVPPMINGNDTAVQYFYARPYYQWLVAFQPNDTNLYAKPLVELYNLQVKEYARFAVLIDRNRVYKSDIDGATSLQQPSSAINRGATNKLEYQPDGSGIRYLSDYKQPRTLRKLKANAPLTSPPKAPGASCVEDSSALPPEPTDAAYTKPTVMKPVTINFP